MDLQLIQCDADPLQATDLPQIVGVIILNSQQ